MTALTTDALVEAMARHMADEYWHRMGSGGQWDKLSASGREPWRKRARAALAALVDALGLTKTQLEDTAYWIDESTMYLEGAEIEGFKSPDPVAALLRALAGAAEGGT